MLDVIIRQWQCGRNADDGYNRERHRRVGDEPVRLQAGVDVHRDWVLFVCGAASQL
jgi:hypothetical protein